MNVTMSMGGENEMDTGSLVGTEVSSLDGQQYPDLSSIIDGVRLDAPESLAEDDVVYVDTHGDETSAPSRCGGAPCPPCAPEPSIQAHLANSTYGELVRLTTSIGIQLGQNLPQVCMHVSSRIHKWALVARAPSPDLRYVSRLSLCVCRWSLSATSRTGSPAFSRVSSTACSYPATMVRTSLRGTQLELL